VNAPTWIVVSVIAVTFLGAIVIALTCIWFAVRWIFGNVDPAVDGLEIIYDQLDDVDDASQR